MSILRTDDQVDGVEILKLIIETSDFYRAMAELLAEEEFDSMIRGIAKEREIYIEPFQNLVKKLHDLPANPDPDKELFQVLAGKITKLLSSDSKTAILEKCLHKDEELGELVNKTALGEKSIEFERLLDSLADHIERTRKTLLALENM